MKFMISQFFSKKSKKSDNWMTEENSKIISRFEYFLASLEKDGINLVVSTGVVKSSQVGCGDQMFFRLHAVLPTYFPVERNPETSSSALTAKPLDSIQLPGHSHTHNRELYVYMYACMYIRSHPVAWTYIFARSTVPRSRLDPKKILWECSTSIKEFPSSELKDKAVVIAAGI